MRDDAVVMAQIGRPPRAAVDVVARCHLGLPIAVRMPPRLPDGEPFPTRHWLTCPLLVRRISRLEGEGAVAAFDERAETDPAFKAELLAAHARVASERESLLGEVGGPRPSGGVAGSRGGVKCLHAHYADHLGGGANPVGATVARAVEPTNCATPCVRQDAARVGRADDWREPPLRG